MTMQYSEILTLDGIKYDMFSEPFNQYLAKTKRITRLNFISTALIRGYCGEWLIQDKKLFLTRITGSGYVRNNEKYNIVRLNLRKELKAGIITTTQNAHFLKKLEKECEERIELSLQSLFNASDSVFADWFTGLLIINLDRNLEQTYDSSSEKKVRCLLLSIDAGNLTEKQIKYYANTVNDNNPYLNL